VRFGVAVIPFEPWEHVVRWWRTLGKLGVATIWTPDHLVYPTGASFYEAWTSLAALAGEAPLARIGTLVTSAPLRHPAVLAKQAIALDHISGGRLELGVGAGGSPLDGALVGTDSTTRSERVRSFRAYVERLDELLRGEELRQRPLQQPRPPLTVAAWGRESLRLAAEIADRWSTDGERGLSAEEGLSGVRERVVLLRRYCEEIGRDPATIVRSVVLAHSWIAENPFASRREFESLVGRYAEAGIDELVFYYPPERFYPTVETGLFEQLVTEGLFATATAAAESGEAG
jgi:alkanesulfonate monooxygenase SsuD/methylene tetrahydromethanopterin reductase-like flavin-dependent oxidoreductase (luciferase family)